MKSNIFLPKKINVGFQNRSDTYTERLAYIIYYDEKGKLRKEASWNSWRDKKIDPQEFNNEPTNGFVLNKKAGGYSSGWNHRQTYCRVYDPRGFEFEITIPNLLYILESTNSIKGKGLEGEFVYGWEGKDLLLIPVDSPDYKEIHSYNDKIHSNNFIKAKDLIIGATYKFTDNKDRIYMGKFQGANGENKEVNEYFFREDSYYNDDYFRSYKSISKQIIDVVDEICIENYASLMDKLLKSDKISERDKKKDEYVKYTLEEFKVKTDKSYYRKHFYDSEGKKYFISRYRNYGWYNKQKYYDVYDCERNRLNEIISREESIERIFDKFEPCYLTTCKSNGELIKKWRD